MASGALLLQPLFVSADNQQPEEHIFVTVLTSVRPLTLIVRDLVRLAELEAHIQVSPLLPAGASPHHLALKAKDVARIKAADLLVWVGPQLETFLPKAIDEYRKGRTDLALSGLSDLNESFGEHSDREHQHGGTDPHVWLDPANAAVIARSVKELLVKEMPSRSEVLQLAYLRYLQELSAKTNEISVKLQSVNQGRRSVAVYHDSLGHYLKRFHISQQAALTMVPEQQIGLKSLLQYKKQTEPACLLADIGELSLARGFGEKLGWRLVGFDLLAQNMEVNTYLQYLTGVTGAVEDCLQVSL